MARRVLHDTCMLGLMTFGLLAASQVQNGDFIGVITDPSGAVIGQARVLIHNLGTGYTLEVHSNQDGLYKGQELIVGQYQITVQMPGFQPATSGSLTLNAGTVVRADFQLRVGLQRQTMEVTDAAVAVNTENA